MIYIYSSSSPTSWCFHCPHGWIGNNKREHGEPNVLVKLHPHDQAKRNATLLKFPLSLVFICTPQAQKLLGDSDCLRTT